MIDPITVAGAGVAIWGSKDLLNKLLGPTADYVGGEAANLVERCNINLDAIFQNSWKKLDKRIEDEGGVSPRVLKHILSDGAFCEDQIAIEYYGGILAGSRGESGKDDQSLPFLSKIREMSSIQLRLHYVLYHQIFQNYKDNDINLGEESDSRKAGIYIPHSAFKELISTPDHHKSVVFLTHAVNGLNSHGLINFYTYGDAEHMKKTFPSATEEGVYLTPTYFGAELFLWANGVEIPYGHDFFSYDTFEEFITIPSGIKGLENES